MQEIDIHKNDELMDLVSKLINNEMVYVQLLNDGMNNK